MAVVIDWDLTEPPQRIDQVAAFRPGQVPTAAEMNEYINLLISQGNYNTAWLVMIAEKLTNSLVADINTQLGQITIDIETMYGTQTAAMQAIIAQIDAAADQAVLDMKAAVADTEYGAVDTKITLHQNSLVLSTNGVHGLRYTLPAEVGGDGLLEAYDPTTSTWTTIETSGAQVSNIAIFVDRDNWVLTADGDYTNTILVDGMLDICFPDWSLLPANMKTYSEAERAVRRLLRNLETYDGGIILHATSAPVNSFTILVKDDAASGSDVIANYTEMIGRIGTLETEVDTVNKNLKWKDAGTKTGNAKVYVPISANEIFISCHNSKASTSYYNIPIPIELWSSGTTKYLAIGSSAAQVGGSSIHFSVYVQKTTTTISVQLVVAYIGNQDNLTNSDISVYYR